MPHTHAFQQFMADIASCCHESIDRLRFLIWAAIHGDINQGRFAPWIQYDLCDVGKADTWIGELALDHGSNFFTQRLRHAILMVFTGPLFWHLKLPLVKRLRISDQTALAAQK